MNNRPVSNSDSPLPLEPHIARADLPNAQRKSDLPPFSSVPLLFLVMVKPLSDAFYEVTAVKYIYMLLLGFFVFFARCGQLYQGVAIDPRNKSLFPYTWLTVLYFVFLFGLVVAYPGSLSDVFKIVSPFVFFILVAFVADRWIVYALAVGAVLTICVNAVLLPFDYGWAQWGSVRTFKGYYFFKTDLAYALCFSTLIYALYVRNTITPALVLLVSIAAVQIVLANSRLNYLTFLITVIFIAFKSGISLRSSVRLGLIFMMLALIIMLVYDPTKMLGFDTSNEDAFTQGRSVIWTSLLVGMANFSPLEWLFGLGLSGDSKLVVENSLAGQVGHDAHNEILHLLTTQGIFGLVFYAVLWIKMFRMSHTPDMPKWAHGVGAVALVLFILQGLTAVTSSYATKTWPLVMVLLILRGLGSGSELRKKPSSLWKSHQA